MSKTNETLNDRPAYGLPEAAQYLRLNYATLRSWTSEGGIVHPPANGYVSFSNLLELHVLKAMRRTYNLPLQSIRAALKEVSNHIRSDRPLLDANFATDGIDIFLDADQSLVNLSKRGQLAIKEVISLYLRRIERGSDGLPTRLFPFIVTESDDEPKTISISPAVSFGKSVLTGTGVSTAVIAGRFASRDSILDLATEYGVNPSSIEDAIRWEAPQLLAA
jgi:uncharacterized protein (DUF433 family)/DNA-binding transcriptional MerR regulator